jgi:hypothetical protein
MSEDGPKDNSTVPITSNHAESGESPKLPVGEVPAPGHPEAASTIPASDPTTDRSELLSRARTFLTSPHIQDQDLFAKRQFLVEKGLNESEVEGLLRELVCIQCTHLWIQLATYSRCLACTETNNPPSNLPTTTAFEPPEPPPWPNPTVLLDCRRLSRANLYLLRLWNSLLFGSH